LGARFEFRRTCRVRQLGIHWLSWAALTKCRFLRCIWGGKYLLRKAVNRLTGPTKSARNGHKYGLFAPGETGQLPPRTLRLGPKPVAGRLRLSVCLFRTPIG
jgi:hypothetical protein